jgi:DNA-dependent RNA polymerase auxiliary subunit epsilon
MKQLIKEALEKNKYNIDVIKCLQELEREYDKETEKDNKPDIRDNRKD